MTQVPRPTLLTSGVSVRVAWVLAAIAVLWLAVWWAAR